MKFYTRVILFILLFISGLYYNKQYHRFDPIFSYHSELWADRSGYYVYLPAVFVYHMDGHAMPDSIDHRTGIGFIIQDNGKIFTKYPAGVAFFQAPFYGIATLWDKAQHIPNDGFTHRQHNSVLWAGLFWGLIALFLLYDLLQYYTDKGIAFFVTTTMALGTNLLYYMLVEPGMSHVYSFLLFTWLLWLIVKWQQAGQLTIKLTIALAVCIGMIIAVRQMNLIFAGLILLFFETGSLHAVKERIMAFFKPVVLGLMIVIPAIILIPQVLYYLYLFGKPFMYSYRNEGFDNWASPKIPEILFSPQNGLLLYSPVLLIPVLSIVWMFVKKVPNRWVIAGVLMLVLYSYASWHAWWLGCSFGGRGFVDFFSLFSLPLAWALMEAGSRKKIFRYALGLLVIVLAAVNAKLIWNYDFCFFGEHNWDWDFYFKILTASRE